MDHMVHLLLHPENAFNRCALDDLLGLRHCTSGRPSTLKPLKGEEKAQLPALPGATNVNRRVKDGLRHFPLKPLEAPYIRQQKLLNRINEDRSLRRLPAYCHLEPCYQADPCLDFGALLASPKPTNQKRPRAKPSNGFSAARCPAITNIPNTLAIENQIFSEKLPLSRILDCLINRSEVELLMRKPGQRFRGPEGRILAAITIQTAYRCYRDVKLLRFYKQLRRLLQKVTRSWLFKRRLKQMRQKLAARQLQHRNAAERRLTKPGCPPLCLSSLLKYSPRALQLMQSFIKNRPVLVVPGAASHIDDYYVADYFSAAILAPSLQVAKLFNAKATMRRVVSLLSEKQLAEKRTGETDPDAEDRILQAPGDYNVYEEEQFYDTLAQLITANLPSRVYAFKIDFSYNGLGTATLQLDQYLASFKWANEQRYWRGPSNWNSRQLQEPVYRRILSEVPRLVQTFLVPTNRVAFPNARAYLVQFLTYGGVIEAMPPANDWANLSTEMVIYPDKSTEMLCSGDHMHAGRMLSCWGSTVPMTSVDPIWVNNVSRILTENCIARGLMGYFTIDFVTFFHEESGEQLLWITGIRPGYSANLAMFQLVRMLADADFAIDAQTGAHQLLATSISRPPAVGDLNPPQLQD
ncbi:hypothetical protein SprV_0902681700 [Sparganum proliferum]